MFRDPVLDSFVKLAFGQAFALINPSLNNYSDFRTSLSRKIRVKEGGNEQFEFDVALDRLFLGELAKLDGGARIFSEESGWSGPESAAYTVVFDPLCNSSLASRTFLDAAVGMTFFSGSGIWLAAVIMDYQTGIIAVAQPGETKFWQVQTGQEIHFERTIADRLEDAWVVLTMENQAERSHLAEAESLYSRSRRLISSSGHLYWLRLAEGMIDAYADPFGGEELYEMFACTVAMQAGCVVTDRDGRPFDPAEMLRNFKQDRHYRFYPVAAGSAKLHAELLAALRPAGN